MARGVVTRAGHDPRPATPDTFPGVAGHLEVFNVDYRIVAEQERALDREVLALTRLKRSHWRGRGKNENRRFTSQEYHAKKQREARERRGHRGR